MGEKLVEHIARMIDPKAFKAFDDDYRPGQKAPTHNQMNAIGRMTAARVTAADILDFIKRGPAPGDEKHG